MEQTKLNVVGKIMAYEQDELNEAETIELFQYLVNSGMIHNLQGNYHRTARVLIERGDIDPK